MGRSGIGRGRPRIGGNDVFETGGGAVTDLLLQAWVSGLIELTKLQWMLGGGARWQPGEPLKLLFAGYNGTRNTGSDVRVEEMLRQVRHVLGAERVELAVMTQNFDRTRGYFEGCKQVFLPDIFPPFLYREVRKYHGVVACEGSMFKSKFANALTTMMIGSLGIAAAENKISIAYGAEAGDMDPVPEKMCRRYCGASLVITRNPESQVILSNLDVATELGTDTAWTFTPLGMDYGRETLRKAGWNGSDPVLAVCPINPFWWPVRASIGKLAARGLTGAYRDSHYRSVYFHNSGPKVNAAYAKYVGALAGAVATFRKKRRVFPVLVAMERLDARACRAMAKSLPGVPVFTSDDYDMYQLVSVLRCADLMVSSRYHAIVTSMPALVPSVGVTMDERIRNLMRERGHDDLLFTVEEEGLEEKLVVAMETLIRDADAIRDAIGRTVVRNLRVMARMGVYLEQNVNTIYPAFAVRSGVHSWEEYLPPLNPGLRKLVEQYDGPSRAGVALLQQPASIQQARA
jgi:polysaccharide pyruvyl transferase WcaK-like protein